MALKSMTGFARADGARGQLSWAWEVRTVNGRGLDLRLRIPSGFEPLEQPVRELCQKKLARGNCSINLNVQRRGGTGEIRLNEDALKQVAAAAEKARALVGEGTVAVDGLLAVKGVLEIIEADEDEAEAAARSDAMMRDLEAALDGVVAARSDEGTRMAGVLTGLIDEIGALTQAIERAPARTPEAVRERLGQQVARLLEEAPQLDEQRLHQEAVLLAAKADIQEEIERLKAHVAAARELLSSSKPAGRRLDFLTQELNREANTICSKSIDTEITRTGLALKTSIDRMREQVQNIE